MSAYRKRPVVIEARQLTNTNAAELAQWCGGLVRWAHPPHGVQISTLEGIIYADTGDWIIQGVEGEFYPCKPGIFEKTYEPVIS